MKYHTIAECSKSHFWLDIYLLIHTVLSQGKLAIAICAELHCDCEHFFPIRKVSAVVFSDHDPKMEGMSYTQRMRSRTRYLPIAFTVNDIGQFRPRLGKKLKTLICLSGDTECRFDNPAEKFLPKV